MKRLSWKYIAGFVDGEGCVDIRFFRDKRDKNKRILYTRVRMRITQVESCKFVLESLKASFGGVLGGRDLKKKNPNWQNAWTWCLEGKKLRPFLQNIVNHLEIKKEQVRLGIWFIDHLKGKHLPDGLRESIQDEMKAMKRDPQRLSETAVRKIESLGYGLWSKISNACLNCSTTTEKHESNGLCKECYDADRLQKQVCADAIV